MTTNVNTDGVVFNDASTQNTASDYITTKFTGPGSWTAAKSGVKAVRVSAMGGGGNGGSATGNTQPAVTTPQGKVSVTTPAFPRTGSSGGGGGGGFVIGWVDGAVIPGSAVPVTVGPNSPSSFGSFITATAGAAGTPAVAPTGTSVSTPGGAAGTGTNVANSTIAAVGGDGYGGTPANGPGGRAGGLEFGVVGPGSSGSATGYGNGGGGAVRPGPGTTSGGTGSTGWILVEEFY